MSDFLKNYDAITDSQLRSCVKLLGKLLGKTIVSHAGKDVYLAVEKPVSYTHLTLPTKA